MAVSNFGSGGGGFQVSPGINISEIDITSVVPAVSSTVGAIGGVFRWGPVDKLQLVDSENSLAILYGKPSNLNSETWFTAASFLSYSNALYVSRAKDVSLLSAVAGTGLSTSNSAHTVLNSDDHEAKQATFDAAVDYVARYPGALGNTLKVSVCDSAAQYSSNVNLGTVGSNTLFGNAATKLTLAVGSNTAQVVLANTGALVNDNSAPYAITVKAQFTVGDVITVGNSTIGTQTIKITGLGETSTTVYANGSNLPAGYAAFSVSLDQPLKLAGAVDTVTVPRFWEYFNQVNQAPGKSEFQNSYGTNVNDELHVVVADEDGLFTGNPGTVLEVYAGLSRATDAKLSDGGTNYYKNVINSRSQFIWFASDRALATSAAAASLTASTNTVPLTLSFVGGVDTATEDAILFGGLATAYDLFATTAGIDISLLMTGKSRGGSTGEQLGNYLIDNVAEVRKDCIVFVSPRREAVVNNPITAAADIVAMRNNMRSSSYGVMDSGYKYIYDKYNDLYRYIPLNGDIAGLCVRTDANRDPWFSPAGINRGQIKNSIKLSYNPSKADRDVLYKSSVNPVVTQPGYGSMLFGDKTLLSKPSAFDRINVRRLFIVLEKAVANAAQSTIFEFNDEFTRTQFRNLIEPFLRDIQGRRGIYDYKVVCDETNNTAEVIDGNRFVGDIYVKPAKSINYIQLNFVAVRSGIEFSAIVG